MYRYVFTFSDGRHRVGIVPSLACLEAEIWEAEWACRRKNKAKVVSVDCWRCKK